jgi:hypothetical protein
MHACIVVKETIVQSYATTKPEGTTAETLHFDIQNSPVLQGVKAQEWLPGLPLNYQVVRRKAA